MSDLDRLVQRARQLRRWETSSFPTGAGGTVHYPAPSLRGGKPVTAGIGGEIIIGAQPCGQLIDLSTSTAHIGPGGEPIVWDAFGPQHVGWEDAVVPAAQYAAPCDAVYGIELNLRQPESTVGGEVWIYVNGDPFKQFGGYQAAWTRYEGTEEIVVNAGDLISIVVDHDGDTDLEFTGTLTIGGKERLSETVGQPVVEGDWVFVQGPTVVDVDMPPATVAGDLLVAVATGRATTPIASLGITGTGWTNLGGAATSGGSAGGAAVGAAWRVAPAGSPTTETLQLGSAGSIEVTVVRFDQAFGLAVAADDVASTNSLVSTFPTPDVGTIGAGGVAVMAGTIRGALGTVTWDESDIMVTSDIDRWAQGFVTTPGGSVRNFTRTLASGRAASVAVRLA